MFSLAGVILKTKSSRLSDKLIHATSFSDNKNSRQTPPQLIKNKLNLGKRLITSYRTIRNAVKMPRLDKLYKVKKIYFKVASQEK
jgi:hypothetical protein